MRRPALLDHLAEDDERLRDEARPLLEERLHLGARARIEAPAVLLELRDLDDLEVVVRRVASVEQAFEPSDDVAPDRGEAPSEGVVDLADEAVVGRGIDA